MGCATRVFLKLNLLLPSHHPFWWDYFFLEKSSSNIFQAYRNPCAGCVCRNFQKTPFFRECSNFFSENIDSALILQEKLATKLVLFTGFSGFHENYGGPSRFDHSRRKIASPRKSNSSEATSMCFGDEGLGFVEMCAGFVAGKEKTYTEVLKKGP